MTLGQLACVAFALLCAVIAGRSAWRYFFHNGDGVGAGMAGLCAVFFAWLSGVTLW
jgi:hypothetical protein